MERSDLSDLDGQWALIGFTEGDPAPDGSSSWVLPGWVPLEDQEVAEAREAIRILTEESEQGALNLVLEELKEFFALFSRIPAEWERERQGQRNRAYRIQTDVSTKLFAWLQSIRAYLDHTETRLNRSYGADSDELAAFKWATSTEFDGVFAYRFLYKLRNFTHVSFPALKLSFHDTLGPDGRPSESFSITLVRDTLLAEFHKWGEIVRRDLKAQPAEFDLVGLMPQMMDCLGRIKQAVGEAERPTMQRHAEVLRRIVARMEDTPGAPHLIRLTIGANGIPTHSTLVPIPEISMEAKAEAS